MAKLTQAQINTLKNEIIKKDIYLDRLKELKASKEKELEEIIKAMESVQLQKKDLTK